MQRELGSPWRGLARLFLGSRCARRYRAWVTCPRRGLVVDRATLTWVLVALFGCVNEAPSERATSGDRDAGADASAEELPVARPGHVVVRRAQAWTRSVEVRCKESERLVGGGCRCEGHSFAVQGSPFGESKTDTRGAGWRCDLPSGIEGAQREVFALCQGAEAEPAVSPTAPR